MLKLKNIAKKYPNNQNYTLKNIDVTVDKGDVVVIVGGSGNGKTTLLNIIGLIDQNFEGEYLININWLTTKIKNKLHI